MLFKNLLVWLFVLSVSSSCAVQKMPTGLTKYQQAVLCYESGNYSEALRFFEEAMPLVRGKQEEVSACFYRAYCSFYRKAYVLGSDGFRSFCKTFPRDHRVEEAMYMWAYGLYLSSPDVRLDQAYTREAIEVLRNYLDAYPEGVYVNKANLQLRELNEKLALKAFNSAKLYHQLTHYRAAVVTLENFQKYFPDSSYSEEAAYLKVDAQYCYFKALAKTRKYVDTARYNRKKTSGLEVDISEEDKWMTPHGSLRSEQKDDDKDQVRVAIAYCREFLDGYPGSRHALAVGNIYENLLFLTNLPNH